MTEALSLKTSVYSRPFHSFIAAVNSGGAMTVLCASRVRPSVCLWSVVRPSHIIVPFILSKIKVCGFLGPCVMCLALQIFLSQSCTVSEILRLVQLAWRRTVTLNRTVVSEESSACQVDRDYAASLQWRHQDVEPGVGGRTTCVVTKSRRNHTNFNVNIINCKTNWISNSMRKMCNVLVFIAHWIYTLNINCQIGVYAQAAKGGGHVPHRWWL